MARRILLFVLLLGVSAIGQAPTGFDLTLIDVDGTRKVLGRLPPSVYAPRVSPDGRQIAFETRDLKGPDGARLWVADFSNIANRRPLPITMGPTNWAPMWSPDGQRIAFLVAGERPDAVYWTRADGAGTGEHLIDARSAEGWNANGAQLRFLTLAANRDYGISLLDMKSRAITRLIDLPGSAQHSSAVSPDGRWMAYASNETGRYEVWLYFDRDAQLFRLAVNPGAPSSTAEPAALPIKGFAQAEYRRQFDLLPNGRQFLMLFPVPAN